ncbi:MAG TPA: caspase family protein [Pirellulales bacterium]
MRSRITFCCILLIACCYGQQQAVVADTSSSESSPTTATKQSSAPIDPNKFRALLVGCTKYDNLKPSRSLQGPANDVALMRRFLTHQLQLNPGSITVLSEIEAAAQGDTFRPTRANIEREIQTLITAVHEGDQVMVLLAGHGGQQPERKDPDPTYLKPDGLDQMFLPCDCGQWNGKKWCVERAISDYELRNWCKQITAKKTRLWVILDACCSGWTLRGNATEVSRALSADDLGIPEHDLALAQQAATARQEATSSAQQSRGASPTASTRGAFDFGEQSPDFVGLYAAQRDESELEMPMPYGEVDAQKQTIQGLLTYAVIDILSHASQRITYGELANLVRQRYPQWGRTTGPTPVAEGLAQECEVLGVQRWPGRTNQQWQKNDDGELTINQGQVQGLSPGTIVGLYPSIDQADAKTLLGYAKVADTELMQSTIKPIKFQEVPAPRKSALSNGGRFEVALTDYGSLRVKIGVDLQSSLSDPSAAASMPAIGQSNALKQIAKDLKQACLWENSLCEFVADEKNARWVVQRRGNNLVLISQDAAQIRGDLPPDTVYVRITDSQPVTEIMRDMTRIARAQNLLNLTAVQQTITGNIPGQTGIDDDFLHPNVELKMLRFQNKSDHTGTEIKFDEGPLVLTPGEYVGWQMTNLGKCDVAVSLLYIDAGFGIKAIFPRAGAGTDNILTKKVGKFVTKPAKITANPAGLEHVVLLAVPRRAEQQSPNFSFLEQETLTRVRGTDDNSSLESPLGRLLQNAMYGHGGTRGLESTDTEQSQLLLQSWRVTSDAATP